MSSKNRAVAKTGRDLKNSFLSPKLRNQFLTPFDNIFDSFVKQAFPEFEKDFGVGFFGNQSFPKVDILDYPEKLEIIAEIPGLKKDDLDVSVEDGVLSIAGQTKKEEKTSDDENVRVLRKELKHTKFCRSFKLDDGNLDSDKIKAEFKNGILTLSVPKKEKDETRVKKKIEIT